MMHLSVLAVFPKDGKATIKRFLQRHIIQRRSISYCNRTPVVLSIMLLLQKIKSKKKHENYSCNIVVIS